MLRTKSQKEAWGRLSKNHKRILLSHLPDELEREQNLRHSINTALENVYGPKQWDVALALIDEGEAVNTDYMIDREPDGMSFEEIGKELKISRATAQQICSKAMEKLWKNPIIIELYYAERFSNIDDINRALRNALCNINNE